jgi:regulator of sigma E protease
MFDIALAVIIFLVILSFLVIIHEFGHFFAARIFGVKVEEFGLGYPPKAKDLFTKWGTVFTLNWLPFGGFVRLSGEERSSQEQSSSNSYLFYNKPAWQRVIVLAAGAAVNFLFGILAFSIIFTIQGIPELRQLDQGLLITQVTQGSPAQESGLTPGDIILSYVQDGAQVPIQSIDQFTSHLDQVRGTQLALIVDRGATLDTIENEQTSVYVRSQEEIANPDQDGAVGIGISQETISFISYPWWQMPFRGAWTGLASAFSFGIAIFLGLGQMFQRIFMSGALPQDIAGPVGIAREVYQQKIFEGGILPTLNFAAVISINLAIVNLLPVPALDGGRIVVLILEKIFGKAFKPVYEQYANLFGFIFLLSLIILITIKDIGVIFSDIGLDFHTLSGLFTG